MVPATSVPRKVVHAVGSPLLLPLVMTSKVDAEPYPFVVMTSWLDALTEAVRPKPAVLNAWLRAVEMDVSVWLLVVVYETVWPPTRNCIVSAGFSLPLPIDAPVTEPLAAAVVMFTAQLALSTV